jgi:predicted N-acetyltransferase YhbS
MYDVYHYPKEKGYQNDFFRVIDFLNNFNDKYEFIFMHWSRFEWMFGRDSFKAEDLENIAMFQKDGDIKGILLFEDDPNDVYFAVYEDDDTLKKEMVEYFVKHHPESDMIIPEDETMKNLLANYGFEKTDWIDPVTKFSRIDFETPNTNGFEIIPLSEDYRLDQINYALHRGFNHGDDVDYSEKTLEERRHMTSTPNYNKDYTYVARYHGRFVSFVNLFYKKGTKSALVEPVATVPEHRRKYLARACIYKAIEAVRGDGAKEVFVGSNRDVYLNMGFQPFDQATRYKRKKK